VPEGPTILVAHEFFDAMPVHQFQLTERGWCERLIDLAPILFDDKGSPVGDGLRLVLSPFPTPATRALVPRRIGHLSLDEQNKLSRLEIAPRSMAIWEQIARRVGAHGGGALAVDYGEAGPLFDTLQAIRTHEFVEILDRPGSADLSAYVDFGALDIAAGKSGAPVISYGPIEQRHFLAGLGIETRAQALADIVGEEGLDALHDGFVRLTSEEGLGVRYKVSAIAHAASPIPFVPPQP